LERGQTIDNNSHKHIQGLARQCTGKTWNRSVLVLSYMVCITSISMLKSQASGSGFEVILRSELQGGQASLGCIEESRTSQYGTSERIYVHGTGCLAERFLCVLQYLRQRPARSSLFDFLGASSKRS